MKSIITEEMRFRKKTVECAIKHNNNALAARKYHTSTPQVWRWRNRYDGTWESLRPKSRRPKSHPNQHTDEELALIKKKYQRYGHEGLAETYVQCVRAGYQRTYDSMCRQIRKRKWKRTEEKKKAYPKSRWQPEPVTYPGEKVQIDIKYVPVQCMGWDSHGVRYYQITAIDEYSRKRVCSIVDEKSVNHTAAFLKRLEQRFGFPIHCVQTDNGSEFTNDPSQTDRLSLFEKQLEALDIKYKKTRPYSPWQNGKVERSHREDTERFYMREFKSLEALIKAHTRYVNRGNNIHRKVLGFKSPNEVVAAYFSKAI